MTFHFRLLLFVWICCSSFLCIAQSPAKRFHWDWRTVEKDGWDSIGESKSLSPEERVGLIAAIAAQLRPDMSDWGIESE